jgi:hypothetical protein
LSRLASNHDPPYPSSWRKVFCYSKVLQPLNFPRIFSNQFFFNIEAGTQVLNLLGTCLLLEPYPSPFAFSLFFRQGLILSLLGLALNCDPPIPASGVARNIGMCHHAWSLKIIFNGWLTPLKVYPSILLKARLGNHLSCKKMCDLVIKSFSQPQLWPYVSN